MKCYKISDIIFSINTDNYNIFINDGNIKNKFHHYFDSYSGCYPTYDYNIIIVESEKFEDDGEFLMHVPLYNLFKKDNMRRFVFAQFDQAKNQNNYTYTMDISLDWKDCIIYDHIGMRIWDTNQKIRSLLFIIRYYAEAVFLQNNSFLIHGVALQYNSKGIIFSANSGIGKTTHTNFWAKKFNAEILNGDSPIIKIVDNKPIIYGSPWCGTSEISINKHILLNAIVLIKRGQKNTIQKLAKADGLKYILSQIYRPIWESNLLNNCLDYCDIMIKNINIYELECLPNEESADVALAGIAEIYE